MLRGGGVKLSDSKLLAFTLAEVLITLGIIGIVASLTIPTLMQKTQEKQMQVGWKKAFAEISQAHEQLNEEYGGTYTDECDKFDDSCLKNLFMTKLKYVKACNKSLTEECVATSKFLDGTTAKMTPLNNNLPAIITPAGYSVKFRFHDKGCASTYASCGWMQIDVNGLKNPNTVGKDIFFLEIQKDILKPGTTGTAVNDSFSMTKTQEELNNDCYNGSGVACSAIYLLN